MPESVPRTRGDEPAASLPYYELEIVFPAPAGMTLQLRRLDGVDLGVPRARGDEPGDEPALVSDNTCSPRPRG